MTTTDTTGRATVSDTRAAIEAGLVAAGPQLLAGGSAYAVAVPAGGDVKVIDRDLDKYRDRPRRKTGTVVVHDADGFVKYLAKHGLPETEIYADAPRNSLAAVINAHQLAPEDADADAVSDDEGAGWGDHRVRLELHHTTAWKAWAGYDRRLLTQVDFAEHIEDRLVDIVTPTGADMLELAQTFQATRSVAFESSRRLSSGLTQLAYREDETATAGKKGQVAIPDRFELGMVPYEGGEPYKVGARLCYRITGTTLTLGYVLDRPEDVLRSAFLDTVVDVATRTERTVINGTPTA